MQETADAVAHLIELGYADQLVLSHDVFLKQMWAKMAVMAGDLFQMFSGLSGGARRR